MSGKLDQSLDTIVAARRKNSRPLRRSRRVGVGAKPTVAPIGGVKKSTKPAKKNDKVTVPAGNIKPESKIMVSNLVSALSP
jgi:THO complex subunit 4